MNIELLFGESARAWLDDPVNVSAWRSLHQRYGDGNAYLTPGFCSVWHAHYGVSFELILALGHDEQGELAAIMPLARDADGITGAGSYHAEYQGWLASPALSGAFLDATLDALATEAPASSLRMKYVLPGPCSNALLARAERDRRVQITTHQRPLLETDLEAVQATLRKKGNRSKLNRLRRQGELDLARVATPVDFDRFMPAAFAAYDLRQGAVNNTCPFHEDPVKYAFHRDWLEQCPEDLTISQLTLDGQHVAGFFGVRIGAQLANAIVSHDPRLAAHSVSKLHIYLLAEELAGEGYTHLDLTPGGDPWKARFATHWEDVLECVVWPSAAHRERAERTAARRALARSALARCRLAPADLRRLADRARRVTPAAIFRRLVRSLTETTEYRVYSLDREQLEARTQTQTGGDSVRRDDLAALPRFRATTRWLSRQQFLAAACERLAAGEQLYTVSDAERLEHYGWLNPEQAASRFSEVDYEYTYPEAGAVLYDFYTDPHCRGRGLYRQSIATMLAELSALDEGPNRVYISVLADNAPSRHVIEKSGFEYHESIIRRTRFWRTRREVRRC